MVKKSLHDSEVVSDINVHCLHGTSTLSMVITNYRIDYNAHAF